MSSTPAMPGRIEVEHRGSVWIARLDGGPQGLMGLNMADELARLVDAVEEDASVDAVVFTGTHPQRFIGHADVRWLQEDLANFFTRTKTDSFKQILDEMKASQIDIGLEEIRSQLGSNHSYIATENSKRWAAKLTEWATKLEGEKNKDGSGGGEGGAPSPEDEDFEFMLRVMKLVQQEQDLRAQTRALEQLRRNNGSTNPSGR